MLTPYRQHFPSFYSHSATNKETVHPVSLYKKTVLSLPNSELFWENVSSVWGYAPHTRGYFLMKRKYPKIHQKPAGFWISIGKGALPPLDSPMNTLHKRGSVTACGYCGGNFPQGICKGKPLTHAFADFSRERKVSASVGGMSPQN